MEDAPITKPEVYSSMRQAAGVKGVSVGLLRSAKEKGCPGFRDGGRLDWGLVGPWIQAHADELTEGEEDSKRYWEIFKLKADAKRSQLALEKEQGLYLSKTEVAQNLTALAGATKALLKTTLEDTLPQQIQGKDAISIKEIMARTVDDVCRHFQREFERWL